MQYPEDFLKQLDRQKNKTTYARVTILTFEERPLETIEGRLTSGSVSLDGNSALRRTCQLAMVVQDVNLSDYYWGLNTKFKLAIGVENQIDNNYPEIIWFEQGLYIVTQFSQAYTANAYNINISGQDKMCLLNGTVAGNLSSSVDFGSMDQEVILPSGEKVWKNIKIPVKDIIREAVHTYGGEPFHNIIINDLDDIGLNLQTYRYDVPMYIWRVAGDASYIQGTLDGTKNISVLTGENPGSKTLEQLEPSELDSLSQDFNEAPEGAIIVFPGDDKNQYQVAKLNYGDTAGYTEQTLVYPGDLIANIGESIVSILDKIKNTFGDFEYFYNVQGQFVFQKKKTYISTNFTPIITLESGESYVDTSLTDIAYNFSGSEFFTSFNNTPNLQDLKNDYSVWGTRTSASGTPVPVHMRYAIDSKPIAYQSISVLDSELEEYNLIHNLNVKGSSSVLYIVDESYGKLIKGEGFFVDENGSLVFDKIVADNVDNNLIVNGISGEIEQTTLSIEKYVVCDWREIIYRMALDYRKYNHLDDFEQRIIDANQEIGHYQTGRTGYEQYYIDIEGFWRQLYDPYTWDGEKLDTIQENIEYQTKLIEDAKEALENESVTEQYEEALKSVIENAENELEYLNEQKEWLEKYYDNSSELRPFGFAKAIYETPETLNFWFDFLDADGELSQFSVPKLGSRPKVVNDNAVKAIYYKDTPSIIFTKKMPTVRKSGYRYFNAPGLESMFIRSAQGKSAKGEIDNLLYNHGYCSESVSINSIPIYYLEPNMRVYINDAEAGIEGEYIVSRLTLPLTYNGSMSITATRAPSRLL